MIYDCADSPKKAKDSTASHSSNSGSSTKRNRSYRIEKVFNPVIDEDEFEKNRKSGIKKKKAENIIQRSLQTLFAKIKIKNLLNLQRKSRVSLYQSLEMLVKRLQKEQKEAFEVIKNAKNWMISENSSEFIYHDENIFAEIPVSECNQTNKEFFRIFNENSKAKVYKADFDESIGLGNSKMYQRKIDPPSHNYNQNNQTRKPASLSDFSEFTDMNFSKLEFVKVNDISFNIGKFELLGNTHEKLFAMYKETQQNIDQKTSELMKILDHRDDLIAQIEYNKKLIEKLMGVIAKKNKF
ncbi:unnamed protein product [Blepharisma stoltei]|uniref:Uncharacterized protein n=1 Tax=Blepharisma stoltei TaxID=1481888 RepID=A0AAU9JWH8_9CILI|nr:unnamed protein product [Blepharisma stoltei]